MDTVASFHQFQTNGGFSRIIIEEGETFIPLFYIRIFICACIYICRIFSFLASLHSIKLFISKVDHFKDSLKSFHDCSTHLLFIVTFTVLKAPSTIRSKLQDIEALRHLNNKAMSLFSNVSMGQ